MAQGIIKASVRVIFLTSFLFEAAFEQVYFDHEFLPFSFEAFGGEEKGDRLWLPFTFTNQAEVEEYVRPLEPSFIPYPARNHFSDRDG